MRPVPHSDETPAPKPPNNVTVGEGNSDADDQVGERIYNDPTFEQSGPSSNRSFLAEADLNDLFWILNLCKSQAEILVAGLKGWNLRQHDTKTWYFRYLQNGLRHFFTQENNLVLVMVLVVL
jgi:hypothetical protein